MPAPSTISENRKARHDFHILEEYEAGIVLRGTEIKSIRQGKINLRDAFARIHNGECWLYNCSIEPYENASHAQHESKRNRKLLLHKKEIAAISLATQAKGQTLVALKAYWKNSRVKIKLGLAKGKEQRDKRHALKESVEKREAQRAMANFNRRG